jgi:hypothetical protein
MGKAMSMPNMTLQSKRKMLGQPGAKFRKRILLGSEQLLLFPCRCLRCAEDGRVDVVLLGEDEGDNALRQRCLQTKPSPAGAGEEKVRRQLKKLSRVKAGHEGV